MLILAEVKEGQYVSSASYYKVCLLFLFSSQYNNDYATEHFGVTVSSRDTVLILHVHKWKTVSLWVYNHASQFT